MVIATRYLVRPMRMSDISQVLEIERESFPTMWPPTAFKRELQQNRLARYIVIVEHNPYTARQAEDAERHAGPVARFIGEIRQMLSGEEEMPLPPPEDRPELVVGVVGVWMMPDEAHIVTIATRGTHRRRGIGEAMLIAAIEMAQDSGEPLVTLEVRVSNEAALGLYEKYGFAEVGRRTRYYSDNHEDAFILTIDSVVTRRYRERFDALRLEHKSRWGDFHVGE